jgi:hypothetical protein
MGWDKNLAMWDSWSALLAWPALVVTPHRRLVAVTVAAALLAIVPLKAPPPGAIASAW